MFVTLLLAFALAQDTGRAHSLDLDDVYRAVRAANPRIAAARALASAANARTSLAKLPPDPQIQLGVMNYALPSLVPMEVVGMSQLQVMQMVPTAGKLGLAGRVAHSSAAATAERALDVEWSVRSEAAMAFYDLYATRHSLIIARETLRLLRDVLATAEAMYRVGEGRQSDVLRAQVAIARMVEDTLRMTAMQTAMGARLNAVMDRGTAAPLASPRLPGFPVDLLPLDTLLAYAQTTRPMVVAAVRELEGAQAQERLARREIWPDLVIGAQYGQRGGAMGGTERMGSLMVGATLPVFAKGRQLRMRQESEAMRQMADADVAAMRAATRADVAAAYASLVRARNLSALYRTTVIPQAEAAASSAMAAYRVGSVDFMTVLDGRMTVNTYRQELFALDADQGKAWAELEMLTGQPLIGARYAQR